MGNKHNRPSTLVPGSIACVGITKDPSSDVVYSEVKRNYRLAHNGFEQDPYKLFGTGRYSVPAGLQQYFPNIGEYQQYVITPIDETLQSVNKKRELIRSLLMKNPNNTYTLNYVRHIDTLLGRLIKPCQPCLFDDSDNPVFFVDINGYYSVVSGAKSGVDFYWRAILFNVRYNILHVSEKWK
jgi:hypothetical protein